ncbi:homeodomain-like protein [Tanacetum coccineum]
MAYPCLYFTKYHEGFKTNTLYLESTIRCIQGLLSMKILEDIKRGPYSKKSPIHLRYKEFKELIQPFKDLERVSQLDRKLLKTTADKSSIHRTDASQYSVPNLQNRNLFSNSKKMTLPSPNHLYDDYWDESKETALADLGANVSVMPYSTYTTLGLGDLIPTKLIVELANRTVKQSKGIVENVLVGIDKFTFPVDFIILDILEDFKSPLILGRPFLSIAHAIINVFKAKITLRVGNDKIFFKSNKPTSNIIKRVYALSLIKSTELDLESRVMGNALRKNRSYDPKFKDYIELSDLNEPLELRHNQVVDLGPTIEEGEVIDTPIKEMVKTRHDDDKITNGVKDYPSFSNLDRKIRVNDAYNLRFFCIIGYEHVDANFFPLLSINMMSKRFYNSIMKDKLEFKGKSVVGAFMNAPIFVGTFSVVTDFAVIEDMDHYRDEEMGDVIVGKEFCKEIRVKAKRFEGMITIYNGNDEMTYQMARSHPRFKHLTNEQCNKIPPLLKMSEEDKMNGISHLYKDTTKDSRPIRRIQNLLYAVSKCSDNQYALSIKEDTAYLCLHFTKDHEGNKTNTAYPKEAIRRIQDIKCEDSRRYQTWSLLQEIPNMPYRRTLIRLIDTLLTTKLPSVGYTARESVVLEYSEEEVAETMAETMEQYMSKTRVDYGSGVARPKIEDKDNFKLKANFSRNYVPTLSAVQIMKMLMNTLRKTRSTKTSDGLVAIQAQLNNLGREIMKVNKKVYAGQVGCEQCKGPHYTKDFPLKEEGKTLKEAYYTQFGAPFQGEGYRATTSGFYQRNNANPSYQERRQSIEETLIKFMGESAKRHEENSNLIKEIRALMDATIKYQ